MLTGKILVVDDEPNIAEVVRLYLEHSGYQALILNRGQEVVNTLQFEKPELLVLDIMLPDATGYEICESIRKLEGPISETPIIFLTAKGESIDKMRGFNLGVDDYIVKPFDPNELIARIKAVLRRTKQRNSDKPEAKVMQPKLLRFGRVCVDLEQFRVTVDGVRIEMTPKKSSFCIFWLAIRGVYIQEKICLGLFGISTLVEGLEP
jgi:DNA-binding response OmpR family regulator